MQAYTKDPTEALPGESEVIRTAAPPSATISNEVREFLDLSPRKQMEVANKEWKAYAQEQAERHPLTQHTHAQEDTLRDAIPRGEPQHIRTPAEKPGSVVEAAENPDLKNSAYEYRAQVDRPPHGLGAVHGEGESLRGKLRVDTFGMADTLNEGEDEVRQIKENRGGRLKDKRKV
ncbi:hypothetical protein SpCBS45565_g06108 [Spizellomyces sp. 'palustris']|nr:hypothetical protein SpCBS45565_g06108 [Spizellomyces sp. 'palustris']